MKKELLKRNRTESILSIVTCGCRTWSRNFIEMFDPNCYGKFLDMSQINQLLNYVSEKFRICRRRLQPRNRRLQLDGHITLIREEKLCTKFLKKPVLEGSYS